MKLSDLLSGIANVPIDADIAGLCLDSRQVKPGDAFLALNGALQHGLHYVPQALEKGATAIVFDPAGIKEPQPRLTECVSVAVNGLDQYLGEIAARFFGRPSQQIGVIGITGTNGKTTCSQLLAQALPDCGVIGTLGWGEPGQLETTANTTPDALAVQSILRALVDSGKRNVAMEVSSHGLQQGRVNATDFIGAVFTNLSRDHLDFHGDMQAYLQAKLALFANPALRFAVVNLDDPNSGQVIATLNANVRCWTFSLQGKRETGAEAVFASQIEQTAAGIRFTAHWQEKTLAAYAPLVGAFNLQNVLTVLCVLLALDWPFELAVASLARLKPVSGRMEKFGGAGKPTVIVDYAHTPDALEKVLLASKGAGRLWAIFGCGGDRDKGKRPQMGRIAETYADKVVVTDDNPRNEAPDAIINEILQGCETDKVSIINDREIAITTVIQQAAQDDCVVIAGKGHENYQDVNGRKIPFSDQLVVQQALASWRPAA